MKYSHTPLLLISITLAATVLLFAWCNPAASETRVSGVFTDRDGQRHSWQINDANALLWNDEPFVPVGGMFTPRYFFLDQTEEHWEADVRALQTLKSKGILDIYINPVRGATKVPVESWQRLIDYLEAEGFRYGVELTDGPAKPLTGWIIRPNIYRQADITSDTSIDLELNGAVGGIYAVADARTGNIDRMGSLSHTGEAAVTVRGSSENPKVLLAYPLKTVISDDGLQNFWEGYGEYRDRLFAHLRQIRFGSGLRFWVDPFINEMGMRGETEFLIPASNQYQIELEAWLRKKYRDFASLARAWALPAAVSSYEQASQLIPLWRDTRGIGSVYNTRTGQDHKLAHANGKMWEDLEEFRGDSIRGYLNDVSKLLKRQIANVPVILKWTANYSFFLNDDPAGFDGLGVEAYGEPHILGPYAGAQCLAMVNRSNRPMWLITTEMSTQAQPEGKDWTGFKSQEELTSCLEALRFSGSKGFYVFGFHLSPPWDKFDLLADERQLDWLKDYEEKIATEPLFADWRPRIVWFSQKNPLGADLRRLEYDLWWLPDDRTAEEVVVEPEIRAFRIRETGGEAVYLWTEGQPRDLELRKPENLRPEVIYTGEPRETRMGKNTFTIRVTKDPAIIRGLEPGYFMTPSNLAGQVTRLDDLIRKAESRGMLVGTYKTSLETARGMIRSERTELAAGTLSRAIAQLEPQVAATIWMEAEAAPEFSFMQVGYNPQANRMRYIAIDTTMPPPMGPYGVTIPFMASEESDYEIWIAGSRPGLWGSMVSWSVDASSWVEAKVDDSPFTEYAPGMTWTRIGLVRLSAGSHIFRLKLVGPAKGSDSYRFLLDTIVLTRERFDPGRMR